MSAPLDKAARLAAEAAAAAEAARAATASLDPKFPYKAIAFDPEFFQLDAETGPPASD